MALSTSNSIIWYGLLGPSDDGLDRTVAHLSWNAHAQNSRIESPESAGISILAQTPFGRDGETRVARLNEKFRVVEVLRKGASLGFAAIGEDHIELGLFLEHFERNCLKVLGYEHAKSMTTSSIKSHKEALQTMADAFVRHGRIEHIDVESTLSTRKLLVSSSKALTSFKT